MHHLSSKLLHVITTAHPDQVWDVVTSGGEEPGYLYGLDVSSDWRVGSTITVGTTGGPQLSGEVLRADSPNRLSFTLGDTVDDPSVYVTWDISAAPAGTIVRLYVDEPDPSSPTEIESAWLPVLAALDNRVQRCEGGPGQR